MKAGIVGIAPKYRNKLHTILFVIFLSLFTAIVAYVSLGGNKFDFEVYPSLSGDAASMAMRIRSIQENGILGLYFNPRIGAPDGSASLIDAPSLDLLLAFIVWTLDFVFRPSTARLFYYSFIVTFTITALSMSYLLYKMKIKPSINFVFSSLYSLGPYHFYRYPDHLAIGNAVTVPLTILISLYIIGYVDFDNLKDKIGLACSGILIGIGCPYFSFFGLILFTTAILVQCIIKTWKEIISKIWIVFLTMLTFVLTQIPVKLYDTINGKNELAFVRSAVEQETYGLKIIQMLFPVSYSRIPSLAKITADYNSSIIKVIENRYSSLGVIASIGFIILCMFLIFSLIKKPTDRRVKWLLVDFLSLSTLVLVLISSIGGFGEIFNIAVTPQIRCYNRASIVIMCISLTCVAYLIDTLLTDKKNMCRILCASVLVVGLYDQVKPYDVDEDLKRNHLKDVQEMYTGFYTKIQEQVAENSCIYQLPYIDFPEGQGKFECADYKHFNAYLLTENIRWSYGGIKGRNTRAKDLNVGDGMSYPFLYGLLQNNFSGVYIDIDGYGDGGTQILEFYNKLNIKTITSDDGRLYYFDISDVYIPEEYLAPGYFLIESWSSEYGIKKSIEEIYVLAVGLKERDLDAYAEFFSWISNDTIVSEGTDEEYIDYLYTFFFNREESIEEKNIWVNKMKAGITRENVFDEFLNSNEFRAQQGFETINE